MRSPLHNRRMFYGIPGGCPHWCSVKWRVFVWLGFLIVCSAACSAASQPASRPALPPQVRSQDCGDLHIQFHLSQSQDQTPTYQASIRDQSGQLPNNIARVLFAFTLLPEPGKAMGSTTTLTAQPSGDGRYVSTGGFRMTSGQWQVEVIVRRQNGSDGNDGGEVVCAFSFAGQGRSTTHQYG